MQSRLTVIATLVFLAGIAIFVWYLSSATREQAMSTPVIPPKAQKQATVNALSPKPEPALTVTPQRPKVEPLPQAPAPESPSIAGARVEGIVVTQKGAPIKDAKVFVGPETAEPHAQTNEKGRFVIDGLSPLDSLITVTHEKYATGFASISPEIGRTAEVRMTLEKGGRVEGIVTRGGAPAPGETVRYTQKIVVTSESEPLPWEGSTITHHATTDAQGHYAIENLSFGEVELEVDEAEAGGTRQTECTRAVAYVEPGQTTVVNFDLPLAQSVIQGVVLFEGQPPEDAAVWVNLVSEYGPYYVKVSPNPDGAYRVEHLPAGGGTLTARIASPQGTLRRSVEIALGESQTVQNDFLFSAACVVSGAVTGVLAGEYAEVAAMTEFPSPASVLTLEDLLNMGNNVASDCPVSPEGTFRLEGLEPGSYTIVAIVLGAQGEQRGMPQFRTARRQVILVAGTEIQVNLALH